MPKLITNKFDEIMEKRLVKMTEVDRLLSMVETHTGLSLMAESRIDQIINKRGAKNMHERTKETSSTSKTAEAILGETIDRLGGLSDLQPHGDFGGQFDEIAAREPHM
jgi:hypothetical protein